MDNWLPLLVPSITAALGGLATWFIQSRVDEVRKTEEVLRSDRRRVYSEILEPYIRLFASMKSGSGQAAATETILSFEYRKTSFELGLLGSDNVVRAYNEMMQFVFSGRGTTDSVQVMLMWGKLLLEIRRSLGNRKTGLSEVDMLRGMITDIDKQMENRRRGGK